MTEALDQFAIARMGSSMTRVRYGERERPEHRPRGLLIDVQVAHAPRTVSEVRVMVKIDSIISQLWIWAGQIATRLLRDLNGCYCLNLALATTIRCPFDRHLAGDTVA